MLTTIAVQSLPSGQYVATAPDLARLRLTDGRARPC
jgi:hypothetical protein